MSVVRRLSHLDAALWALETPTNHMHLGLLARFGPLPGGADSAAGTSGTAGDVDIVALLKERISAHPGVEQLRSRVVPAPLGLGLPAVVDAGPLDLDYHVRWAELPSPGDSGALDAWIGAELSQPLDRSHPLWQVHVLQGLDDGGFALFIKGHHGVYDGVVALRMALSVLDGHEVSGAVPGEVGSAGEGSGADPAISAGERLSSWHELQAVLGSVLGWPLRLIRVFDDPTRHTVRLAQLPPTPKFFSAPRTFFNRAIGPRRAVVSVTLPLEPILAIRREVGVTANDVVLTVVSEAVRVRLAERGGAVGGGAVRGGGVPTRPLVAIVPAAQSGEAYGRRSANRLNFWFVSLATDRPDLLDRLRTIADSSKAARAKARLRGAEVWERWSAAAPPGLLHLVVRVYERLRLANVLPPLGSLIVSNLAGPRRPLTLAGAPLVGLWPFGPPKDGGAINITMVSYNGVLNVGLQGDERLAQDLAAIAAALPTSLERLQGVVNGC